MPVAIPSWKRFSSEWVKLPINEARSLVTIVLLRHGRTAWNRTGLVMGQKDVSLDAGGRQEAHKAARALTGIDAIYSSPLLRCAKTADIIGSYLGLSVTHVPGLVERHWGVFEGRPRSERDRSRDPEGGETAEAFRARVEATLPHLIGSRPLVVTHSGVIRLLCSDAPVFIPHTVPIELPERYDRSGLTSY